MFSPGYGPILKRPNFGNFLRFGHLLKNNKKWYHKFLICFRIYPKELTQQKQKKVILEILSFGLLFVKHIICNNGSKDSRN